MRALWRDGSSAGGHQMHGHGGAGADQHKLSFRPDIEGLRAVAIGLVVAFHAGVPQLAGGYVGVDVFFALSGYLITRLLLAELEKKGTIGLLSFYARRARRLLPAAALVLLCTVGFGAVFLSPLEQARIAKTALATAVYLSNVHFARRKTDYWDAGSHDDPLLHTWSLAVEEQFYFLWPPLLLIAVWLARKAGADRRRTVLAVTTVGSLASFALAVWLTGYMQPMAFFLPFSRAWEFAAGALLAMVPLRPGRLHGIWPDVLTLAGLGLILLAALTYDATTVFPGVTAILPVAGTLVALRAGEVRREPSRINRWGLHHPAMQFIGRLSYSWYLWHWPVLVFHAYLFENTWFSRAAAVALSLLLAVLAHHLVENPIRYSRALQQRDRLTLASAGALTVVSLSAALGWIAFSREMGSRPAHLPILVASEDLPVVYHREGCIGAELTRDPTGCVFGREDGAVDVVLIGDSHALSWLPPLDAIAKERGWKLTLFSKTRCPVADVEFVISELGRAYVECTEWREKAIERIGEMKPAIVFVANAQGYTVDAQGLPVDEWIGALGRTLRRLGEASGNVVLIADNPYPQRHVPICLSRAQWRGAQPEACAVAESAAVPASLLGREAEVARALPNGGVIDLTGEFCADGVCPAVIEDRIVYRDTNHLTASFALHLKGPFEAALEQALASAQVEHAAN